MGYKIYGEDEPKRSRIGVFIESFICSFMAFTSCIGGWLVHFGMAASWMFLLSAVIALAAAWKLLREE